MSPAATARAGASAAPGSACAYTVARRAIVERRESMTTSAASRDAVRVVRHLDRRPRPGADAAAVVHVVAVAGDVVDATVFAVYLCAAAVVARAAQRPAGVQSCCLLAGLTA